MIGTVKQLSLLLLNIETARAEALVEGCMKSTGVGRAGGFAGIEVMRLKYSQEFCLGLMSEERITQVYRNT